MGNLGNSLLWSRNQLALYSLNSRRNQLLTFPFRPSAVVAPGVVVHSCHNCEEQLQKEYGGDRVAGTAKTARAITRQPVVIVDDALP